MSNSTESVHEEAAVLTRAIENLLRKLIRFLIGKISLVSLQEIIRYLFVEEIENMLRKENPSKSIPLTQLALLSGLDTRTLTKIRNSERFRRPFHREANFLREFAPGAAILDVWNSKPPYVNEVTGEPKVLQISGGKVSFESLFDECGKSRGVTYKSLLQRLAKSGAVDLDSDKSEVRLISMSYLPSDAKDRLGAIEMGFSAIGNMVETVTRNILALEEGTERLYQRGAWTFRLNEGDKSALRSRLRELLQHTDTSARSIIAEFEENYASAEQITAGVSLFYFEETTH